MGVKEILLAICFEKKILEDFALKCSEKVISFIKNSIIDFPNFFQILNNLSFLKKIILMNSII